MRVENPHLRALVVAIAATSVILVKARIQFGGAHP